MPAEDIPDLVRDAEAAGLYWHDGRLELLPDPRPGHPWAGTSRGHDCAECPQWSRWRCQRRAHRSDPPNH